MAYTESFADNYKEYNGMLGVRRTGNFLVFTTIIKEGSKGFLVLYGIKGKKPICKISLDDKRIYGSIYEVRVDNSIYNAAFYNYEIDGQEVTDRYAKAVTGFEKFGRHENRHFGVISSYDKEIEDFLINDKSPDIKFEDMVMYKLHVRGFTRGMSVKDKGTYNALTDRISYLKELGINSILFMPIVEFDESFSDKNTYLDKDYLHNEENKTAYFGTNLRANNRINYWGYSKNAYYLAPKSAYASNPSDCIKEFKHMVKSLHEAGICVFMEFIFGENTGIMERFDILRSWAVNYHIDGFKITASEISADMFLNDPVLTKTKFITDYADISLFKNIPSNYIKNRVLIYNDLFKEKLRCFVKGDANSAEAAAYMFTGAGLLTARVNYAADNNGYTLNDVYSYQQKHNLDNGEDNNDGTDNNFSWNCGIEGATNKKKINELRKKLIKNALTGVILSEGTPMIYAGDECLNTQKGNNNAYCQDNKIGWTSFNTTQDAIEITEYLKKIIALRKENILFRMPGGLKQMDYISSGYPDISVHGTSAWYADFKSDDRIAGFLRCGKYAAVKGFDDVPDSYVVYNMHWNDKKMELPQTSNNGKWKLYCSTGKVTINDDGTACIEGRSSAVFLSECSSQITKNVPKEDEE